jgi:hypothetical protein
MGFLVGVLGLVVGFIGFWTDFSADPFSVQSSSTNFDIGVAGIAIAVAAFIVQMWPRRRARALQGQASARVRKRSESFVM